MMKDFSESLLKQKHREYKKTFSDEFSLRTYRAISCVNTPFLTQHHRRIIKPPACTRQVSYH